MFDVNRVSVISDGLVNVNRLRCSHDFRLAVPEIQRDDVTIIIDDACGRKAEGHLRP